MTTITFHRDDAVDLVDAAPPTAAAIVVGIDGSGYALRAARWAAQEAELRSAPLELLQAYWLGSLRHMDLAPAADKLSMLRDLGTAALTDARSVLRRSHPTVNISSRLVYGRPIEVVSRHSAGAQLMVIGRRDRAGAESLGPVSWSVAATSRSAVAVVPPTLTTAGDVVVAIDTTAPSMAALEYAFEAAVIRHTALVVVRLLPPNTPGADDSSRPTQAVPAQSLAAQLRCLQKRFTGVDVRHTLTRRSLSVAVLTDAPAAQLFVVGMGHRSRDPRWLSADLLDIVRCSPVPVVITQRHLT